MRDLLNVVHTWDESVSYVHTTIFWREDNKIYSADHPKPTFDLKTLVGDLVPHSHLYPIVHPSYFLASSISRETAYVKAPNLVGYEKDSPNFGSNMVTEIKACQAIRAQPHPNLAEYQGCICEDGYVVGLCFKRYETNLRDAVRNSRKLDYAAVLEGIRSGVKHLHSLGLVHNDIKPSNIMIDENDTGVLIDFDSCYPNGSEFPETSKQGTVGWTRDGEFSEWENDFYSLEKVTEWLSTELAGTSAL